jgi:hypothetical protein
MPPLNPPDTVVKACTPRPRRPAVDRQPKIDREPTPEVLSSLRSRNIAWAKAQPRIGGVT